MVAIAVKSFNGMTPLVAPHLLPGDRSQLALNTKLFRGDLRPFKNLKNIATLPAGNAPSVIFRYGESQVTDTQYWFTFAEDVDVVRSPIANDSYERVYFTGDTTGGADYPKYTRNDIALSGGPPYPQVKRRLGLPSPDPLSTSVLGVPDNEDDLADYWSYVMTFVSDAGEEGPTSDLTTEKEVRPGQGVRITMPTAVPGAWTGTTVVIAKRLYRSATGNSGRADLQFVIELPLATATYDDFAKQTALGEVCPARKWSAPPASLRGLCLGANGVMAGFLNGKNTVQFSEAFMPHAWPEDYTTTTEYPVVGIGAMEQGFLICTKGNPYVVLGSDPGSMTAVKVPLQQACVSKRSIVSIDGGVIYASHDGLVMGTPNGVNLITKGLMSREDWQAYVPSSIKAFQYENRYYALYDTGSEKGMLVFDFTGETPAMTKLDIGAIGPHCAFYDAQRDALYLACKSGSNAPTVEKWDDGTGYLTSRWQSKRFIMPTPTNFSCAKVECDLGTGAIVFYLYADGVLKHTQSVLNSKPFWLPSGYMAGEFYFEIVTTGNAVVRTVTIAQGIAELVGE